MGQEYDILIDIDNVIVILILIGIPMWVWGAWTKKRNPANARAPWIARIGLILTIVALVWMIVDLLIGRLVTVR